MHHRVSIKYILSAEGTHCRGLFHLGNPFPRQGFNPIGNERQYVESVRNWFTFYRVSVEILLH